MLLAVCLMIAALPLSVSAAGEYVPGNPRWSGYQNQVQWGRPAGAASGDSFEYEAQLLLGDDVVESKAVEIDTYLFFTNDVVTRPQEEYTIRVRARWIMIVGDPDGQYMVADVGEAEPPHEHSYTQKHDAAQHWQACSCGERLNVANHITDNRTAKTGNGTCNAYLKDVFGFFLYLADNGYTEPLRVLAYNQITVSNAVGVKRTIRSKSFKGYLKEKDRNVRAAQEPEIIDILRACTNLRDQLLLLLLAETGFRIGEILGVDYTKDIDYEKQVLKVYFRDDNDNEARAKNAEYRSAKISRETFEFLLHYLAEYRRLLQRQSLLFINIRGETAGKPMRVESVYDMLDRMEEKTGIKLTPHMLRRYYAVSRRDAGWALELIQLALGHKHLDTTVKYLGILDNQLMTASREFYEKHSDLYGIKDLL